MLKARTDTSTSPFVAQSCASVCLMDGTIKSVAKGVVTGSKEGNIAPNIERSKACAARLIVFPWHIEVNEPKEGDSIVSFPSFRLFSVAQIHPG